MKGIFKDSEPQIFKTWKAQANENWKPTFDKLQNPEKGVVRKSLLKEQGYICAYCCNRIDIDDRTIVIEHFIPQSHPISGSENALKYDNLFACCSGRKIDNKSQNAVFCCDENKKDQFQSKENPKITLLKPTERNESGFICEQAFRYDIIGEILANSGVHYSNANYTIETLNLNNSELKREREETAAFLFEDFDNGDFFDFSQSEVDKLKHSYSRKDEQGRFYPFCQIVLYFLDSYY